MKAGMKRALVLLAATCLLGGTVVALGDGLSIEDEAEWTRPAPEEIETDLWTEDMQTAGEQAVMPMEWTDDASDVTGDAVKMEGLEIEVMHTDLVVPNPSQISVLTKEVRSELNSVGCFCTETIMVRLADYTEKIEYTVEDESVLKLEETTMNSATFLALKPGKTKVLCKGNGDRKATVQFTVSQIDFVQVDEAHFPDPQFREFLAKRFKLINGSLIPKATADETEKLDSYQA